MSKERRPGDSKSSLVLSVQSSTHKVELEGLSRLLKKELLALNEVESVDPKKAAPVPRSKALPVDWQTLPVTLAASGGVLTTLIRTIQAVITRQDDTSVTLNMDGDKIVIKGMSSDTEKRLVNAWISRHKTS